MNYLKIENNGLLDIRLVALMGGTTKSGDKYKIGQFGTGLKYVLAFLFRMRIQFYVFVDGVKVDISLKKETIGEDEFEIICINGEKTSITTKMGLEWEPWMIIRELYSNALDEGGSKYGVTEDLSASKGKTTFFIECVPDILKVYNNWNKYFIVGHVPMFENNNFSIHPSGQSLKIYKQGILVHENERVKSVFSYDIKNVEINEMREYKGTDYYDIFICLSKLDKKSITYFLENVTEDHFEGGIDCAWMSGNFSKSWEEAIGSAKIIHKEAVDNIKEKGLDIDLASTITVPVNLYKGLTKKFDGIGALKVADKAGDFYETHNSDLDLKIKSGLATLETAGYYVDPEMKFLTGIFGDKNVLARVNTDTKECLVSELLADKSMFEVISMIIEENEHIKTGFSDCTRAFQQHFIDLYAITLLKSNDIQL